MNRSTKTGGLFPRGKSYAKAVSLIFAAMFCLNMPVMAAAGQNGMNPAVQQQQGKKITVVVKDAAGALQGAGVIVKGTSNGATTDANGSVSLNNVSENATLLVSYLGYVDQEVKTNGSSYVEVVLKEDSNYLDELVVIGYGTVKKRDLTGSVSSVKSKDLTEYTVSNPIMALQGKVAGVNITSTSGSPNGSFNIRVRGANSIRGDNSPLYIIDGMPSNASAVNAHDIQSIEVLKDASATAIYGSRGANGVILITTKGGHSGKTTVEYNGEVGVQTLRKKMDMLDASEYMQLINIQQLNDVGKAYFTDEQIANAGKGYDWQDAVYSPATVQNHNVTVSGGNDKTRFNVSGSAMLRDGIIKTTDYNKFNIRSSIDTDISKYFNLSVKLGYTHTNHCTRFGFDVVNRGGSVTTAALLAPPTLEPFDEEGKYNNLQLAYPFMSNAMVNPINIIDAADTKTAANLVDAQAALTVKPFKGFSFRTSFGLENNDYMSDTYRNSKYLYGGTTASVSHTRSTNAINENIANYSVTLGGNHDLNIMAGFTYQQNVTKSLGGSGNGYLSDAMGPWNLSAAETPGIPWSGYSKWALMSWLARVNYSYKGKYLLTASVRADGSSRYSEGNKWGVFPSGAIAWRMSEEPWLKSVSQITDLKIRAGYGVTGSTAISPYATQNMLASGSTPVGGGNIVTFFTPSTTYPGSLRWEQTSQVDVGVDLAMFNNRLRFTADLYYKLTTDLLNSVHLPLSSGYGSTLKNIGSMSNRGLELLLEGEIISTKDWNWSASANISFNKNRVEKLAGGNDLYGSSMGLIIIDGVVNLIREGEPMGVFYVYETDGYDEKGSYKYVDQNEDGKYTDADRKILGNPNPLFTYGFNTTLSYKNAYLSMVWTGTYGNDVYNLADAQFCDYGMGLNMRKDVLYSHWDASNTPEQNAKAKYPKITQNQPLKHSDRFIEDGSYLRLKNIQLGYTFPIKRAEWIDHLTLYISAQNLLTITKYRGLDPEVNSYASDITLGIDQNSYPMNKSFSIGASIKF